MILNKGGVKYEMKKTVNEPFLINPYRISKRGTKRISSIRRRLKKRSPRLVKNPIGSEVIIVGGNPWWNDSAGHSRAAKKGWRAKKRRGGRRLSVSARPVRRRRKRKAVALKSATPVRRRRRRTKKAVARRPVRRRVATKRRRKSAVARRPARRRSVARRRNPAISLPRILGVDLGTVLPLAITGGISIIATSAVPNMLGVQGRWATYGVKIAVGIGGSLVIRKTIGRSHALIWVVSSASVIVAELLKTYVLGNILPGLAAFPDESGVAAYPEEVELGNEYGAPVEYGMDGIGEGYPYGGEVAY